MRIKCNCGKELKITQGEIDKNVVFLCTNCKEHHYLDLFVIDSITDWLKNNPYTRVKHK